MSKTDEREIVVAHEHRLPECERFQCEIATEVKEHIRESGPVRSDVERLKNQVLTMEKSQGAIMEDIKDIKHELVGVNQAIAQLSWEIKVWVLSGVLGSIVVFAIPVTSIFYRMGRTDKQVEINTERWHAVIEGKVIQ